MDQHLVNLRNTRGIGGQISFQIVSHFIWENLKAIISSKQFDLTAMSFRNKVFTLKSQFTFNT